MGNYAIYRYLDGVKHYYRGQDPRFHWSDCWDEAIGNAEIYTDIQQVWRIVDRMGIGTYVEVIPNCE